MSTATPPRSPWDHHRRFVPPPTAPGLSQEDGASKGKSPYRRGRDFERAARGVLERRHYFVQRAHASKGKVDLLAVSRITAQAQVSGLFIQCKRRGEIGSAEWNELYEIARAAGGWAIVAFRPSPRKIAWMRIDAPRERGRQGRPWTEIDPETCRPVEALPTLPLA